MKAAGRAAAETSAASAASSASKSVSCSAAAARGTASEIKRSRRDPRTTLHALKGFKCTILLLPPVAVVGQNRENPSGFRMV